MSAYEVIIIDARDAGQVDERGRSRDRTVIGECETLWKAYDVLEKHMKKDTARINTIYWAIEREGEVLDSWTWTLGSTLGSKGERNHAN